MEADSLFHLRAMFRHNQDKFIYGDIVHGRTNVLYSMNILCNLEILWYFQKVRLSALHR